MDLIIKNLSNEIQRIKSEDFSGKYVEVNKEENYRIKILYRGEHLFYQEGDRAIICEIEIRSGTILSQSINKWDNGKKISDEEKSIILSRLKLYFKMYQQIETKVI